MHRDSSCKFLARLTIAKFIMKNKLLYISDQGELSNHSFVENVVNGFLSKYFDIYTVYFSKNHGFEVKGNKIIFPRGVRNSPVKYIEETKCVDLDAISYVIVRNNFKALSSVIDFVGKRNIKVGFQLSFPHSYRRVYEAWQENKSILRKRLEYFFVSRREASLIEKCDIFFPISMSMKKEFFPGVQVKTCPLGLGVDPYKITLKKQNNQGRLRFIYIGTVDHLRRLDVVFNVLSSMKEDFDLRVFTKEADYARSLIKTPDPRIQINEFIPREELFQEISKSDVGIFLLPVNDLYKVASPTKVMEYYSCLVPSIMSKIDECVELFENREAGWLCDFDESSLKKTFEEVFKCSRDQIRKMGERGQKILLEKRNYEIMALEIYKSMISL